MEPNFYSINEFSTSYHTITKENKLEAIPKISLPPINNHLFLSCCINVKPLKQIIVQKQNKLQMPLFTYKEWLKVCQDVKTYFKKIFHQRLKQINSGQLLIAKPGQSISIRTDYYCLHPHKVYTVLVPLQKCSIQSCTIGVAVANSTKFQNYQNQQDLLIDIGAKHLQWIYSNLEEGDIVFIGRDNIYGSFRNDSEETKHFVEMRFVKNEHSSSSSNSS